MLINVEGLKQGQRTLEGKETAWEMGHDAADFSFLDKTIFRARITKMGDDVFVECAFLTAIEQECCRCLEPFRFEIQNDFKTLFVPEKPARVFRHEPRKPLRSNEDDGVEHYMNKEIDLSKAILAAVGLMLPLKPLCRPDCLGLCTQCGANLNQESCNCSNSPPASHYNPFAALKKKLSE